MSRIEDKLGALGLVLPPPTQPPPGVILPFQFIRIVGRRALISGHGPQNSDGSFALPLGKLGRELTVEQGYAAARMTALSIFGSLQRALGRIAVVRWALRSFPSISRSKSKVKLNCSAMRSRWSREGRSDSIVFCCADRRNRHGDQHANCNHTLRSHSCRGQRGGSWQSSA